MVNRVMVIGCSGSGKSTLSRKLHTVLQLPVIHLDRHYWKPDWTPTSNEEWDSQIEAFAMREQWIIDGNYSRTLDRRMKRADLIVYLDMPRWLCLYRVLKRRIQYHGKTRPDLNEDCPEKLDLEFLKWIWNYRKRSRAKTLDKLEQVKGQTEVVIIRSGQQLQAFVARLEKETDAGLKGAGLKKTARKSEEWKDDAKA